MAAGPGQFYEWLTQAVKRGGSQRTLYTPETTLSRRGLLTRADKRARELSSLGIRASDVVAVGLGNVVEYFITLMGASKIGVKIMPVDPANGDRTLIEAMRRVPVRAVVRRQRGLEAAPLEYPSSYALKSRRQLSATMVACDVLEAPRRLAPPADSIEVIVEATGPDGIARDVHRTGDQIRAIGRAAATALGLLPKQRLVCVESLTAPTFFDPVVLGWLASDAQLVVTSSPGLDEALALAQGAEEGIIVYASRPVLADLGRKLAVRNESLDLQVVLPGLGSTSRFARTCRQRFSHPPRELVSQEEVGVIGIHDKALVTADELEARPGDDTGDGAELLIRSPQAGTLLPAAPEGVAGCVTADGFVHTGMVAEFGKKGGLKAIVGRRDALVHLEGRRASLDRIADAMLEHRRITWARARVEPDADGEPVLRLAYVATGETELEDIDEHAVGQLPPFLVPHEFVRLEQPD